LRQSPGASAETVAAAGAPTAAGASGKPPAFANGSIVAGKYLVEETIAEGGIGVVVVAKHLALQQRVAIKYLKPKTLGNPTLVERFVREARLAAQLTSEHVVRVFDVGTLPEAGPYMVMEYLVGEDLGHTVQNGPLPIARAVDYVLQACDALAEAHSRRIVHRDIKPENLFLAQRASATPVLKIIDFGISKVAAKRGDEGHWGTETAASERFGTPLYMSPEQLRSTSSVDARTDIWSLGLVLYELLTGELPFPGDDLPQVCTSVLTGEPSRLTTVRDDAPLGLEAAILKCLEKDPVRRFRNVAELAQELAPFGPTSAAERAERIAEVVRRAGDSVRPPAPAPRLNLPFRRTASTNGREMTTIHLRAPRQPARIATLAGLAVIICAAAVATTVALWVGPARIPMATSLTVPSAGQAVVTANAAGPNAAEPNAAEPATAEATAAGVPAAGESVDPGEATSAMTAVAVRPKPALAPRAHPMTPTPKGAPSIAASGSARRAQFGERE
jgi:serine/threonine-protein kinase